MELSGTLIALGAVFLAGLAAHQVGRVTPLPRVTVLLLLGVACGGSGFGILGPEFTTWFDDLSIVALTMVAFLLGGALTRGKIASFGRAIIRISLSIVIVTLAMVSIGLMALGMEPGLALLLAAIATATAPAAMADVIRQSGVRNGFTYTLRGVVAIDDAWALIAFSVVVGLVGPAQGWGHVLETALWDLGGACILGIAIGAPAAFLTGRLKSGEPLQSEAIGIVCLTAGLSLWLEVSFLVTGMVAGAIIANFARHHERAFHEIEHIQWPFMILFFLLAGAVLEVEVLLHLGWLGLAFLGLRVAARLLGGIVGARLAQAAPHEVPWFGPALLPQAGVAVGMALVAGEKFPDWAPVIMAFTIASTVIFELIGPPVTLHAIRSVAKHEGQNGSGAERAAKA